MEASKEWVVSQNIHAKVKVLNSLTAALAKPGFETASFRCAMTTTAAFTYTSEPREVVTGFFHDASNGKFYILGNCGDNCHFLYAFDNTQWGEKDISSLNDTIIDHIVPDQRDNIMGSTKMSSNLENQVTPNGQHETGITFFSSLQQNGNYLE